MRTSGKDAIGEKMAIYSLKTSTFRPIGSTARLVGINAGTFVTQVLCLKSLGQGGVARGLVHIGRFQILPAPQEVVPNYTRAVDQGVVPGTRAEAVNADTFFYIVSGAHI
jgi:hypothetical protein